jgi:hypothetical protein
MGTVSGPQFNGCRDERTAGTGVAELGDERQWQRPRLLLSMQGGSGALRLAVVGRGEGFHHPGSSHTRARWRLERWSSTTAARIRHERFRSRAPSELTSAMATVRSPGIPPARGADDFRDRYGVSTILPRSPPRSSRAYASRKRSRGSVSATRTVSSPATARPASSASASASGCTCTV